MEAGPFGPLSSSTVTNWASWVAPASDAVGLAFLRCGGASPPAATQSTKTHIAHRRIKIERVYRPYLTALEAGVARFGKRGSRVAHGVHFGNGQLEAWK
jgi:hypothetical protein